jgi:orotate phosphoribosyltransferase
MNAEKLAELLLAAGAVELRSDPADWFTWSSGRRAPIYCDHRLLLSQPAARAQVADALAESIRESFPAVELIAGAATGAIAHAAWVAERLGLPMVYVRPRPKGHGQARQVEGKRLAGERTVLIEDLISLAGSALEMSAALRSEGAELLGVQAIFTYGFPEAAERLRSAGLHWRALSDYDALLRVMPLDPAAARVLLDWRSKPQ